jgi:L-2,4-diaminobutyric acid acetyltransferase
MDADSIQLHVPTSEDGLPLHKLIQQCPPLDPNSVYCNLLHCSHFAATSVAAKQGDELVGFISGYLIPERPDTLFIWQVAVADGARGRGLASLMLTHLLQRPTCSTVRFMETTITPDNQGSWALFRRFAASRQAPLKESVEFDRDRHFSGQHDSEWLVRIGPL